MERLYRILLKKATAILVVLFSFFSAFQPVLAASPNDPEYLRQADVYDQINARTAWDITTGTRRVVVAVIDTGLDTWQSDIAPNVWTNPLEVEGNNKDDDNNGYVDDIHGWNFVENNSDVRTSVFDNQDDKEAVRHGTIVAGLLGAVGNNGYEGTGLNWQVSIMPLRAIRSDGTGAIASVVAAVDYAVNSGADIISMSFVGDDSNMDLYKSLRRAYEKGVVIVTAAGNNDEDSKDRDISNKHVYPACFDKEDGLNENWILTVGSIDGNGKLSYFSNYGNCVDLVAPGENMYSAERYAPQFGYADEFGGPWQGTSFATPLAAGAAALIKSIHPDWTPTEIIKTLVSTTDSIDLLNGDKYGGYGTGRLNVGRAVTAASMQPVKRLVGSLYYQKNKQLWRFVAATEKIEKVATFAEATIISINPFHLEPTGLDGVALILKRGSYYYLHIIKADGTFFKEFAVKGPNGKSVLLPSSASVFYGVDRLFFVIEQGNGKATTYSIFDSKGVKKGEKTVNFVPLGWSVDPSTQALYAVRLKGAVLQFGQYSFVNKDEQITTLDKVSAVYGLRSDVSSVQSAIMVMLVERGGKLTLVQKAASSKNLTTTVLPGISYNKKDAWRLALMPLGTTTFVLPYSLKGGVYRSVASLANPSLSVRLPALPTSVR